MYYKATEKEKQAILVNLKADIDIKTKAIDVYSLAIEKMPKYKAINNTLINKLNIALAEKYGTHEVERYDAPSEQVGNVYFYLSTEYKKTLVFSIEVEKWDAFNGGLHKNYEQIRLDLWNDENTPEELVECMNKQIEHNHQSIAEDLKQIKNIDKNINGYNKLVELHKELEDETNYIFREILKTR